MEIIQQQCISTAVYWPPEIQCQCIHRFMQYFTRWNENQNSALVSIYIFIIRRGPCTRPRPCRTGGRCGLSRAWCCPRRSGCRWGSPGRSGWPGLRCMQSVENIPFIQFISRRLKWLWLGMIKGLNWIKIQQVFIGTNRYQDRYSRDIFPLDGA